MNQKTVFRACQSQRCFSWNLEWVWRFWTFFGQKKCPFLPKPLEIPKNFATHTDFSSFYNLPFFDTYIGGHFLV